MYHITYSKEYRKKLKKLRTSGKFKEDPLREIVTKLALNSMLPPQANDHALSGDLSEFRECHIKGDLLLIYQIDKEMRILTLSDIGTHHQLFGN